MKKYLLIVCALLVTVVATAQPSWTKKATRSVFTLKTFAADGSLLGSSTGFYVSEDGVALSSFAPFKGAARAVVITSQGKEFEVDCILGANETYDVAKFRVNQKKTQPLVLTSARQPEGTVLWLLPYRETKKVPKGQVLKTETFADVYDYYTVDMQMPDNTDGAPLLNDAGEVVGLMQQPSTAGETQSYAVSAVYADSLRIHGLSINDAALRSTSIRKPLPDTESQALLTLYVAGNVLDSIGYARLVDEFIETFPTSHEGYLYRASLEANGQRFAEADNDMAKALEVSTSPDEVHYSYSRLVYQTAVLMPDAYAGWTLDKALDEARQAYDSRPLAVYKQQQGHVLFVQKKFDEAFDTYQQLFDSVALQPDIFIDASRCKEQLGDTIGRLEMLDRAVSCFSKPYLREAAPYLLVRAQANIQAGNYRKAVLDLNDYELLVASQVNDNFYYVRYQAEVGGRLFQQALNDIDKAFSMNPQNDLYLAEKASLQVRVGMYDDAIETAKACVALAPDHSDGYLFLGLAQCLKGQKEEGVKNLQRAGELGDPQAADLIEKYK